MLILKLVVVPFCLLLVTLAGRFWGPARAGWLAALPLVTGPILLFLAIDRGAVFAQGAAVAALLAVVASAAFLVVYARAARYFAWPVSLLLALAAWFGVILPLSFLNAAPWQALMVALSAILLTRYPANLFPNTPVLPTSGAGKGCMRELFYRMVCGALLVLLVTDLAGRVGEVWSGLLAVFPVLGSVLAVFTHRDQGPQDVAVTLQAMARGLWSFAAFCFVFAEALTVAGSIAAFATAVLVCLIFHAFVTARESRPNSC